MAGSTDTTIQNTAFYSEYTRCRNLQPPLPWLSRCRQLLGNGCPETTAHAAIGTDTKDGIHNKKIKLPTGLVSLKD